jgi:threonylcarbamoyladenosine tRNA methylthiotransferase MtaB
MRRKYTAAYFINRIKEIKRRYANMALGTDVIAGYPQETSAAFEKSLSLAEELPFTYMHVFPYSTRPGTPAASLPDVVGHNVRKERAARLRSIAFEKKRAYLEAQRGRVIHVLFEEELEEDRYKGTSENYVRVSADSEKDLRGSIVPVLVEYSDGEALRGTLAQSS